MKFTHFLTDHEGYRCELRYIRDRDKREVDFLVVIDNRPWFAVEAKLSDTQPSPHLSYFMERLKIPFAYQVVLHGKKDVHSKGIRVLPADRFLLALI